MYQNPSKHGPCIRDAHPRRRVTAGSSLCLLEASWPPIGQGTPPTSPAIIPTASGRRNAVRKAIRGGVSRGHVGMLSRTYRVATRHIINGFTWYIPFRLCVSARPYERHNGDESRSVRQGGQRGVLEGRGGRSGPEIVQQQSHTRLCGGPRERIEGEHVKRGSRSSPWRGCGSF